MKLFTMIGFVAVYLSVTLADPADKLDILEQSEPDVKDLIGTENGEVDTNNLRKRDSGYSYPRPSRFNIGNSFGRSQSSNSRGKFITKLSNPMRRPFSSYGPPSPTNRPQKHRNKFQGSVGFGTQSIQFSNNDQPDKHLQKEVPSAIRNLSFLETSPIANQNDVPFRSNSANYLPPRNQKLPTYTRPDTFQQSQSINPNGDLQTSFNQNLRLQSQNLIRNRPQDPQISDAAVFLSQNSKKISQLYNSPASNLDYAPSSTDFEKPSGNPQNLNNQLRILDGNIPTQSEQLQNPRGFNVPIPSYSSGILESPRTLENIQSLEKDRLIAQLRQALSSQTQTTEFLRYAQNYGQSVQNENSLSSTGAQISQLDKPNKFNSQGHQDSSFGYGNTAFGQGHFFSDASLGHGSIPITYGLPIGSQAATTPPTTSPTTTMPVHRPQDVAGQGTFHPTAGVFPITHPFPQSNGFEPSLISGTNFVASLPSYGTTFVTSGAANIPGQTSGSSPTYFGLPIPNVPESKPTSTGASSAHPSIPTKPPNTLAHPPVSVQPVYPLPATPVQSIFPVVPASPTHPINGIQPGLVNSVLLKPVKPVFPVYYYQNIAYQLQKPSLPTNSWSYAPGYSLPKSSQSWK